MCCRFRGSMGSVAPQDPATVAVPELGELLRRWRRARHRSQLDLAVAADVSQRHISFIETGRSRPSREMVHHLAIVLDLPLRAHNELMSAAGHAPRFHHRAQDDLDLQAMQHVLNQILESHRPLPAAVIDRGWNIRGVNPGATGLLERLSVDPAARSEPLNLIRLLFHPRGVRQVISNWDRSGRAMWDRLMAEHRRDPFHPALSELAAEVAQWHEFDKKADVDADRDPMLVVTMDMRIGDDDVRMFSTVVNVAAPTDVSLQEMSIELFFGADPSSTALLRSLDPDV